MVAPPLVFEPSGPYDGHNRRPGSAAAKKARRNRRLRRFWNRLLSERVAALARWGLPQEAR